MFGSSKNKWTVWAVVDSSAKDSSVGHGCSPKYWFSREQSGEDYSLASLVICGVGWGGLEHFQKQRLEYSSNFLKNANKDWVHSYE